MIALRLFCGVALAVGVVGCAGDETVSCELVAEGVQMCISSSDSSESECTGEGGTVVDSCPSNHVASCNSNIDGDSGTIYLYSQDDVDTLNAGAALLGEADWCGLFND